MTGQNEMVVTGAEVEAAANVLRGEGLAVDSDRIARAMLTGAARYRLATQQPAADVVEAAFREGYGCGRNGDESGCGLFWGHSAAYAALTEQPRTDGPDLRALLAKIRDKGLIYWVPSTVRGEQAKSNLLDEIDAALSRPTAPADPRVPQAGSIQSDGKGTAYNAAPSVPQADVVEALREAVARLYCASGCSCCRDEEAWEKWSGELARLLDIPAYDDGSGFNFYKVRDEYVALSTAPDSAKGDAK